jgi:dephospho-CoA kinase
VKRAVVERLGERVLDENGEIDRGKVAAIVFADSSQLEWLEGLLHPVVVASYLRWREQLAELPDPPAVSVTEVPLLYEVGGETRFDKVVAVTASPDVRVARSLHVTPGREQRLMPDDEKLRRADFAFVNDGSLEELDAFASDVLAKLTA